MPVNLVCAVCGGSFSVRPSRIKKGAKYCSYACHQVGEGRKGGAVTGNKKRLAGLGISYSKISGRHVHRVVAELIIGRPLESGEIVHHKNGNKLDNSPENLEVTTQSNHIRLHLPMMHAERRSRHGY